LFQFTKTKPLGCDIMRVDPKEVYQYLREKGVEHVHALGMLANIKGESDFKVDVQEEHPLAGQGGYGLFQHTGPRRRALFAAYGGRAPDWKEQIDFALAEHDTVNYLKQKFNTPEEATSWFVRFWERPADPAGGAKKRIAFLAELESHVGSNVA
jgi:Phage tail lysozyme